MNDEMNTEELETTDTTETTDQTTDMDMTEDTLQADTDTLVSRLALTPWTLRQRLTEWAWMPSLSLTS